MDAKLKKQITVAVGVVIGTAIFKKYLSTPIGNALPTKGA